MREFSLTFSCLFG